MRRAVLAAAVGGLKRHGPDLAIIVWLILASLWVRRLTLWDIEGGGDAVRKWFFVKQWFYANSFEDIEWNHHLARFGINLWAFVAQALWGTSPEVYYVAPVAAATAAVVFTYKLGQELAGRWAGLIAALWLLTLEPMERAGSQLLPEAFSAAYMAGALYFLLWYLRYRGDARVRLALLLVTGLFTFFGYLAKMQNLLFVPGMLLALWLCGTHRRDLLIFSGLLVGCYLIETAWYAIFTEHSTRYEIVDASHRGGTVKGVTRTVARARGATGGGGGGGGQIREKTLDLIALFWKLLERYHELWESIRFPLYLSLGASLALAVFARQTPAQAMALVLFGYLFFATFAIRQLDPIKLWMSKEPRYFVVLCPLILAVNSAFSVEILRRLPAVLGPRLQRATLPFQSRFVPLWALLFCTLIGWRYYSENGKLAFKRDFPLKELRKRKTKLENAYRRGLPIAERASRHKKALRVVWSVYLNEDLLVADGKLPSFEERVKRLDGRYDWLSKDPALYRQDALSKLRRDQRCAYVTHIRGRFLRLKPNRTLPSSCKATLRGKG